MTPWWLSHHSPDEYGRCIEIGRWQVCARCLGTYPTLVCCLLVQFALTVQLKHEVDVPLVVGLTLPATLDWAAGRRNPQSFSNTWRVLTGVALGLGLSRSLFIHLQQPFPAVLLIQAAVVTSVALPVILVAWRKGRAR